MKKSVPKFPKWVQPELSAKNEPSSRRIISKNVLPEKDIGTSSQLLLSAVKEIDWLSRQLEKESENEIFWRMLVRSLGSNLESLFWLMKVFSQRMSELNPVQFSNSELKVLRERKFDEKRQEWIPSNFNQEDNARISIRCFAKVSGVEVPNFGKGPLPISFKCWIELRNQFTHPRYPSDLEVSGKDKLVVLEILKWAGEITRWMVLARVSFLDKIKKGEIKVDAEQMLEYHKNTIGELLRPLRESLERETKKSGK